MNLPKIEPIVWQKKQEKKAEVIPAQTQYIPLPQKADIRHDYINPHGILAIHYPGIPDLN